MPDKATELIEQMLDQRLKDITQELHNLYILFEGYMSSAKKDMQTTERTMANLKAAQQALAPHQRFLSGRWPLRDGDSYGTIAAQPAIKLAEPDTDADDTAGDLRSSHQR